jgi:hypothetical protein
MESQDYLDQQLRVANRVPAGFVETDEADALMDEIGARILASPGRSEVRRAGRLRLPFARRGLVLASVLSALVVGGAAAATVSIVESNTVGAPSFCQTVLNETADIPFPSGDQAWRNWALLTSVEGKSGFTLKELCDSGPGARIADDGYPGTFVIPTPVEQATFVAAAVCAWSDQWLGAKQSGDAATVASSASEVEGALQWPATKAAYAGTLPINWLPAAQQAVQAGDVDTVASMFHWLRNGGTAIQGVCTIYAPPSGSDNGTVYEPPSV